MNKSRSAQSVNVNNTLNIALTRNAKLLPYTDFTEMVNMKEVYDEERQSSDTLRLVFSIHPYCTNVLFNNFTEIVKYYKDDNGEYKVDFMPYVTDSANGVTIENEMDFKPLEYKGGDNFKWNSEEAIKDTQLSNENCGYTYHCGLNIFNNHLLRKTTFKAVCKIDDKETDFSKLAELTQVTEEEARMKFNTIEDYMREFDGKLVIDYSDVKFSEEPNLPLHLYLRENLYTFKESVENNLKESNGWLGFNNDSSIATYVDDTEEIPEELGIGRVINSSKACEFIYMYPTPDLYTFTPKYNPYLNRLEKNWNYCLTYPCSSTTKGFEDFLETSPKMMNGQKTDVPLNGLKVASFHENSTEAVFYSITKHGLSESDVVNIYYVYDGFAHPIIQNAEVIGLGTEEGEDKDFVFSINNGGTKISLNWRQITQDEFSKRQLVTDEFITEGRISSNRSCVMKDNTTVIPIVNTDWINTDEQKQNICFKKVVNGVEVDYYVRIFSRIPNWKFADSAVTEYNIYDNPKNKTDKKDGHLDFRERYCTLENDFTSVASDMAYAKTIYNDNVSQIVYTDDVNIGLLHDNLGRPLHEIFLTVIKNNKGYKMWYNDANENTTDSDVYSSKDVEYSHAFGKVNCAFEYSKYSMYNSNLKNVRLLYNTEINPNSGTKPSNDRWGITIKKNDDEDNPLGINDRTNIIDNEYPILEDEIDYYNDIYYYGDLCCYSTANAVEESIEMISFRFNTAQREMKQVSDITCMIAKDLKHDEIQTDDWDYSGFTMFNEDEYTKFTDARQRKEGYFYTPHYRVMIHSFSSELSTEFPDSYRVKDFESDYKGNANVMRVLTDRRNNFTNGEKFVLLNTTTSISYDARVLDINDEDDKQVLNNLCCYSPILNNKMFLFRLYDENGDVLSDNELYQDIMTNMRSYRVLRPDESIIPTYAKLIKDGGVRYAWRDFIKNGYDEMSSLEQFPFTNGAFYVSPRINFFLKRQDPHKEIRDYTFDKVDLSPNGYPFDPDGNAIDVNEINNYYQLEEIKC